MALGTRRWGVLVQLRGLLCAEEWCRADWMSSCRVLQRSGWFFNEGHGKTFGEHFFYGGDPVWLFTVTCRPSVPANSPVMFDVELLYIPGKAIELMLASLVFAMLGSAPCT